MSRINLNHWFINGNEISISLMRFYIKIKILHNNQVLYYQLYIKGENKDELLFNFYTIEDAICFTEQVVNKCDDTIEIMEKYKLMYNNGEFEKVYTKKKKL